MSQRKPNMLVEMLSSGSKISSKRVITALAMLLITICTISELYWDFSVSDNIFDSLMYIVIGGVGFTASEKFTKKTETP